MISRLPVVVLSLMLATLSACAPSHHDNVSPAPASAPAPAPAPSQPTTRAPWYEPEIQAFEAADKASPPPPGQILFIGSSSFRMWKSLAHDMAPMPVLNRGFGGSKTPEVLAVFDRIVIPYKPSIIVYYCGDNDLGTDNTDSQAAADGFITFDRRARSLWPHIQTFYVPIKPSIARWSNWPAMSKANDIVRDYCTKTPGATFLDTITPTLAADGKPSPAIFQTDGLHMNAQGYAIWTKVIRPPLLNAWTEKK